MKCLIKTKLDKNYGYFRKLVPSLSFEFYANWCLCIVPFVIDMMSVLIYGLLYDLRCFFDCVLNDVLASHLIYDRLFYHDFVWCYVLVKHKVTCLCPGPFSSWKSNLSKTRSKKKIEIKNSPF